MTLSYCDLDGSAWSHDPSFGKGSDLVPGPQAARSGLRTPTSERAMAYAAIAWTRTPTVWFGPTTPTSEPKTRVAAILMAQSGLMTLTSEKAPAWSQVLDGSVWSSDPDLGKGYGLDGYGLDLGPRQF